MNRFYPFASTVDLLIFVGFFIGASTMFFMSAMYHTFMCHSFSVRFVLAFSPPHSPSTHVRCAVPSPSSPLPQVFSYVMTWDYVGIFFMIFGSTLSATHVLFYCFDGWRQFYQLAFGTMCARTCLSRPPTMLWSLPVARPFPFPCPFSRVSLTLPVVRSRSSVRSAVGAVCVGLPYFQDDAHRPIKVAIYGGLVFMAVLPIFHAGLIYDLSIVRLALVRVRAGPAARFSNCADGVDRVDCVRARYAICHRRPTGSSSCSCTGRASSSTWCASRRRGSPASLTTLYGFTHPCARDPWSQACRALLTGCLAKRSGSQGASHQLWHLLIVAAGLWHYHSLIEVYQERLDVPCIVA